MLEYEIFTSLIFFLVAFYKINKGRSIDISHVCSFFFAAYVLAVFFITDVGTVFELFYNGIDLQSEQINLYPFSRYIYKPAYAANFIMFMPYGFLASIIERSDIGIIRAAGEGLAFSLIIELSQLLNYRSSDVDDLIINTAGAIAGYAIYKLMFGKKYGKGKMYFEAFIYVIVMFAGHFLLFNEDLYAKIFLY